MKFEPSILHIFPYPKSLCRALSVRQDSSDTSRGSMLHAFFSSGCPVLHAAFMQTATPTPLVSPLMPVWPAIVVASRGDVGVAGSCSTSPTLSPFLG